MLLILNSCQSVVKQYKYELQSLELDKVYTSNSIKNNNPLIKLEKTPVCIESKLDINKNGEFEFKDAKQVPNYMCAFEELLFCYPKKQQAELEGFIKYLFTQYGQGE